MSTIEEIVWKELTQRLKRIDQHTKILWEAIGVVVSRLDPRSYLEIGVQDGGSLRRVIKAGKIKRLVLCDTWGSKYGGLNRGNHRRIENLLKKLKFDGEVEFLDGKSQDLLPGLEDRFDLILIDGDHSYQGAFQDLNNCWHLLTQRGIIVYDDLTHSSHGGDLEKAFNQFVSEKKPNRVFREREKRPGYGLIGK